MNRIKLFCLPYAGGSANEYLKWKKYLAEDIEIIPVELAGRGKRFNEKFYNNFKEMVDDVFDFVKECIEDDCDYALFGHSMGSWIVFEICRKIFESELKKPIHVIFSGNRAPYFKDDEELISILPDNEFIDKVVNLGGVSRNILEYKELGEIFIRILRNDFRVIETYKCEKVNFKIECDISIFNGLDDDLTQDEINSWEKCTSGNTNIYNFEGNHFFINNSMCEVNRKIIEIFGQCNCVVN